MHIFQQVRDIVISSIKSVVVAGDLPEGLALDKITAEPPRDASHGDVATNAAMVLAKPAQKNPREVAALLVDELLQHDWVEGATIAGPGFINLELNPIIWHQLLKTIVETGTEFGTLTVGNGTKVNVEYVSANPTGPMHIGHVRGAVVGDVLARLLSKAGYEVTKEYYINDAGGQVDVLARSAYLRYLEANGLSIEIGEGLYPGEYLVAVGEALKDKYGDKYIDVEESEYLELFKEFALSKMMDMIRADLKLMGIEHDIFSSEKALIEAGAVEKTIETLTSKGLVYRGVLEPPKGEIPDDWEPREQLLFKSSNYGDDVDRALKKSDDSNTYFASDIAYHETKVSRGYHALVNVLGADHGGYVKRIKAAVSALSDSQVSLDVLLYQLVSLFENGEPMKMSKRAGRFVTTRDVVEAVGKDVIRFMMLTRKSDAVLDFDLHKVKEQSKDNPVFYVQYAHARICSVLRHAQEEHSLSASDNQADYALLDDLHEQLTLRKIAEWPRVVEQAAATREPHRIAFYLQELAANLHSLWNAGKDDAELRFVLPENQQLTIARLALITAVKNTIAAGLDVMGVEAIDSM